jgi:uncharacterized membrane protein YeiH
MLTPLMTDMPVAVVHALPTWADLGAVVVAATFGAHAAREPRTPLTGILLAGVVVGVGGGISPGSRPHPIKELPRGGPSPHGS